MSDDDTIIIRRKAVAAVKAAVTKTFALPVWAIAAVAVIGWIVGKVF